MKDERASTDQPPDSIQKGLLQVLWKAHPLVRYCVLLAAGLALIIYAVIPADVRSDLIRNLFGLRKAQETVRPIAEAPENTHVFHMPNGQSVRMTGWIVKNETGINDGIIGSAIEWGAWKYTERCYGRRYGSLNPPLPEGTVEVTFDVINKLPRHAQATRSDFEDPSLGKCMASIVNGQTLNQAGSATGSVVYAFKFVVN